MAQVTSLWQTGTAGIVRAFVAKAAPTKTFFTADDHPFTYTDANWGSPDDFYLEVWLLATSGTVYARLYDETAAAEVASSEVSTASATYVRLVSSALTLVDAHVYRFQLGGDGSSGTVKGVPNLIAL